MPELPLRRFLRSEGYPRASTTLSVDAAAEILTTAEAKTHLRVDHSNDDTYIDALIKLARTRAEEWLNRSFINTTWLLSIDEFHPWLDQDVITLEKSPLSSVTSITTLDEDGNSTVFAASNYYAITNSEPGRVALNQGLDWPTDLRDYDSFRILYVSGWGATAGDIPDQYEEWIKQGVLMTVGALYERRGDELDLITGLTEATKEVLAPLKVYDFA